MKKSPKIIWKLYAFIFTFITLAHFMAIIRPENEIYIFYHILISWSNFFKIHYYLAVSKSVLAIVSLYPLWSYSFNQKLRNNFAFWQWLLVCRIVLEITGNYYELVFIKASYYMILAYGLSVTGAIFLPMIPSYFAHYFFAFQQKFSNDTASSKARSYPETTRLR